MAKRLRRLDITLGMSKPAEALELAQCIKRHLALGHDGSLEGRRVLYHVDKLAVVDLPAIPLIYVDGGDECMANTVLSLEPPYALSPPLVA